MDISALTSEEKAELMAALSGDGHPDAAQDAAMMDDSNEAIANILEAIVERIENLEKAVYDELIGGVRSLYDTNRRKMGIEGLRGKYGKDFDPYQESFSAMQGGADLYDRLFDQIEKLRGDAGDGWNDEAEGGAIGQILETLKKHLAGKAGEAPEIEIEAEGPEGVKIEKTEVGTVGGDDMTDLAELIKRKKKGTRLPNE